jgi:hypothetical protein
MQITSIGCNVYRIDGTDEQQIITLIDVCETQRDRNVMDVDMKDR